MLKQMRYVMNIDKLWVLCRWYESRI
jgi:hypothetical protein